MVDHLLSLLMFYSLHKGLFKQDSRPFNVCEKIKSDIYKIKRVILSHEGIHQAKQIIKTASGRSVKNKENPPKLVS